MDINQLKKYFISFNFFDDLNRKIFSSKNVENQIIASPLYGAAKSFLVQQLAESEEQIIILTSDEKSATELDVELELLSPASKIILLNEFKPEIIQEKLTDISNSSKFILISSYKLLNLQLPDAKEIERETTRINVGGEITFDEIIEYLNLLGYQQTANTI